jgi:hypothetical protein
MRKQGWAVGIALLLAAAACSGDDSDNGGVSGDNPFGNAPPPSRQGSGQPSSGSGSGSAGNSACPEGFARTTRVTPRVILLLDGSCSMTTNYPANGAPSETMCRDNPTGRWAALRNALVGQNGVVTRLAEQVEFGLAIFGTQPRCPIAGDTINPALNQFQAIERAMPQVQPGQFTPTGPALDWVVDNMIRGQVADEDLGPEIIILATDGEPNSCGDANTNYQPSIDAAMKAVSRNATMYVISLADSTGPFHDHLQQMSDIGARGGQGHLYEPSTPEDLAADLERLIGGSIGCDVALNGWVQEGSECMNSSVTLNGDPLRCNDDNGWILLDPRHIRLQGSACDRLNASSGTLQVNFPCGIFTVD